MKILQKIKNWLNSDNNLLFASVSALMLIGLVAMYFIGPYESLRLQHDANFLFNRYWPYAIFGLIAFIVCSKLSKKWVLRLSWIMGVTGILMMLLTIVSPTYILGSARYVRVFGLNINPFLMTLPAYIVLMSHWLGSDKANKKLVSCIATIASLFIIFAAFRAPYMLMAMVYLLAFFVLSYKSRKNMPYVFYSCAIIILALCFSMIYGISTLPHVQNRLVYAIQWTNYPINTSLLAIKSSTLIGSTPESLHALSKMVMPAIDFTFASILAKFGILFGIIVVVLYGIITKTLLNISSKAKDMFNKNISICTCAIFGLMALIGVLYSFGFVYVSSGLPFISFATTQLLTWCILLGFVIATNKE